MTLMNLSYRTNYLHTYFKTTVVVPDTNESNYTAVWLLHGYTGDDSAWIRHVNVEKLARDHNFIVGSSMGGYGALKIAFLNDDKFSKVAALSPITDIEHFRDNPKGPMAKETFNSIFDSPDKIAHNQLINIYNSRQPKQQILTLCGDADFMHEDNIMFKNFLSIHAKGHYTWMPVSGDHSWKTWGDNIEKVFNWLN